MLNRFFAFLLTLSPYSIIAQNSNRQAPTAARTHSEQEALASTKQIAFTNADLDKILMDPKVLHAFANSIAAAHSFITEGGDYPHKTYSLKNNEGRFAMRGITYQIAKGLKAQQELAPYFTLTKKIENVFHELRFENYLINDKNKTKGTLFRAYFRLRSPNSEKISVYMMEWDPKDKSAEGLKLYSIHGALDAWNIDEGMTRTRIGLERNEHKELKKANELLKSYIAKQEEERKSTPP